MSSEKVSQIAIAPPPSFLRKTPPGEKYYDWHPTKEDLMAESNQQAELVDHLRDVLEQRGLLSPLEHWFTASNINIYQDRNNPREYPIAPDVAVFKGVFVNEPKPGKLRSWKMYEPGRPAPRVVIEIASEDTWHEDLTDKPLAYQKLGAHEYFAYDADEPPLWRENRKWPDMRLRGWRNIKGVMLELKRDKQGRIWSQELKRYLVEDVRLLQLYDRLGNRAPTAAQVERQARIAAEQKLQSVEQELQFAEQKLLSEQTAMQELLKKLREKGIAPESL